MNRLEASAVRESGNLKARARAEQRERIVKALRENPESTSSEIGARFGVSRGKIDRIRAEENLPFKKVTLVELLHRRRT